VISTLNKIRREGKQLITVVGAGGDRDRTKRPKMAAISAEGSSKVILTSDNPRTEDPEKILDDMESGITPDVSRKVLRIANRREAIKTAVMLAGAGDVVLVAGKGHETYQEINGVRHHFDDREELKAALQLKNNK
jgi:UDP-N-acetylmuramoyl-L-alanyl-D-glutamate--2,6-diaminopimelate ligase